MSTETCSRSASSNAIFNALSAPPDPSLSDDDTRGLLRLILRLGGLSDVAHFWLTPDRRRDDARACMVVTLENATRQKKKSQDLRRDRLDGLGWHGWEVVGSRPSVAIWSPGPLSC